MKASVLALKQPGNHGPHAGSICKKICPQRPQPGKYDYFAQPESYSRSGAWEFFTEDYVEQSDVRACDGGQGTHGSARQRCSMRKKPLTPYLSVLGPNECDAKQIPAAPVAGTREGLPKS